MPRLQVRTLEHSSKYRIHLDQGILSQTGAVARECFQPQAQRVALISNRRVFSLYGTQVQASLEASNFKVSPWFMGDGERFKTLKTAAQTLKFFHEINLERSDGVVALGGGVVGDLTGFASSLYLRGIPFIQVPTTLMAQVDSSVGGKTGVNMPGGKNLIGSFHQPRAVLIDLETLTTLPTRELSAGWFETVKQGAVASSKLFKETTGFLRKSGYREPWLSSRLAELIRSHVSFKASIVSADEREDMSRSDARSRKILNFGHTVAHALETLTHYRRFRHGEAVGHGMLVAGAISKNLGLLAQSELELLNEGVLLCGPLPSAKDLDTDAILKALTHDKKRAGGKLQWVLLKRIGSPLLVDEKEVSRTLVKSSLHVLKKQLGRNNR